MKKAWKLSGQSLIPHLVQNNNINFCYLISVLAQPIRLHSLSYAGHCRSSCEVGCAPCVVCQGENSAPTSTSPGYVPTSKQKPQEVFNYAGHSSFNQYIFHIGEGWRQPLVVCRARHRRRPDKRRVVRPTGIEPMAYRLGICRSIQLSYGRF